MFCLVHSDRHKVWHLHFKTQDLCQWDHFAGTLRLLEIIVCLHTPSSFAPSPLKVNVNWPILLPKQKRIYFQAGHVYCTCACRHLGYIEVEYEEFWAFSTHKISPRNGEEASTVGEMFFSASLSISNLYFLSAGHIINSYDRHCIDLSLQWVSYHQEKTKYSKFIEFASFLGT